MKHSLPDNAHLIPTNAQKVFDGVMFDTYQWEQELYDGSTATFEMLKRPDTIIVLGVTGQDTVIIIEQEQPNHAKHWSLPAGRIDSGEEPLVAAKREMQEETGFTFADWKLIDVHQPYPKIEWFVYFYVAQNPLERVDQRLDAGERIEVHEVPYAQVVEHIKSGDIRWAEPLLYSILKGKDNLEDILALDSVRG